MLIWSMTGAEDGNKPIIKEIAIGAMWEENKKKIRDVIQGYFKLEGKGPLWRWQSSWHGSDKRPGILICGQNGFGRWNRKQPRNRELKEREHKCVLETEGATRMVEGKQD